MRMVVLTVVVLGLALSINGRPADAANEAASVPPPQIVRSPDETIEVGVSVDGPLTYSIRVDSQLVVGPSRLGLKLRDGTTFGRNVELVSSTSQSADSTWENPLGKRRQVRDQHNQLYLLLRERSAEGRTFELVFRAFNDGVAFRYELLSQPGARDFILDRELTEFTFPADFACYAGEQEKGFAGPQEWEFSRRRLSDIKPESIVGLPLLVETPAGWVAIAEADLIDWSGLWLGAAGTAADDRPPDIINAPAEVSATNGVPLATPPGATPSEASPAVTLVAKLAPRIDGHGLVKADTPHRSAWRVLMIARRPIQLIGSDLIHNLSTPCQLNDTSWIRPGKMAWDHWWTGDTIMTTDVIREYITLAGDMGWPYQLIDWGWYGEPNQPQADITKVVPTLDLDAARNYAAERNVRLWLWLHWADVDRNDAYKTAFPLYHEWGIAGVKIDFMDRDDQEMVNWYEKITRAAADSQLMVNFHGAYKPTGFDRTFPNQLMREGVLGNEYNKWSTRVTPEHKVTLPFTRYLLGAGDFTPGGFLNRQPDQFRPQKPTLVQGTRAAELALLVVYDSPLACLCDHPNHYHDAPGSDFLKIVPTVGDDTRGLDGAVGQYVAVARRSGDDWFLGALTNREPRQMQIKLDFLASGRWRMRLWRDAADAGNDPEHLATESRTVDAGSTLTLRLAPAGGAVARFERQ